MRAENAIRRCPATQRQHRTPPPAAAWRSTESSSSRDHSRLRSSRATRRWSLQTNAGRVPRVDQQPGGVVAGARRVATIEHMTIQRMDHVGIVVDDLAAAVAFFVELGLELQGEAPVEGDWVDRVVGLEGVRAQIAMLETPDGHGRSELAQFHAPSGRAATRTRRRTHRASAMSVRSRRHRRRRRLAFEHRGLVGEVERYQDSYRLCYVRGPEGIIVELWRSRNRLRAPAGRPRFVESGRQDLTCAPGPA